MSTYASILTGSGSRAILFSDCIVNYKMGTYFPVDVYLGGFQFFNTISTVDL